MCSEALHKGVQALLLFFIKDVLWVEDAWGGETLKGLGWVLLEVFLSENLGDLFAEVDVVHKWGVGFIWHTIVFLKKGILS